MGQVTNYKTLEKGFSNELQIHEIEYDFSKDAGAIAVLDMCKMGYAGILKRAYIKVATGVLSAGTPTMQIGIKGGDTDLLLAAAVKGEFLAGGVVNQETVGESYKLAEDVELAFEVITAALTAGKFKLVLEIYPYIY